MSEHLICWGCGSPKTLEDLRREHPGAISCCPERQIITVSEHIARVRAKTIENCEQVVKERMRRSDSLVWVQIHADILSALCALKDKPH